jgi:uncharacterized membrane protein (UPF0182 family)
VVSFGDDVGIGSTLSGALDDVLGQSPTPSTPTTKPPAQNPPTTKPPSKPPSKPGGSTLPVAALRLLQRADAKFAAADKALKAGDLATYAQRVEEGRRLVERALAAGR